MMNIIIPMAGESSRFNYKFKPFLYLDNKRFIEHCLDGFLAHDCMITSYNFIVTKEQEIQNNVTNMMKKIFINISDKICVIVIKEKTTGPYQTILQGIAEMKYMENIVICDCDHSIDISPIIEKIHKSVDIIIPLWNINREEQERWGKIVTDNNNNIVNICEKEIIKKEENINIFGIIGCYYFRTSNILYKDRYNNFSEYFKKYKDTKNILLIKIIKAYFFGTPAMVEETINKRRKLETIFCDVDGVLLKHNPHSNDNYEDNKLLGECVIKLKKWKCENKKIILATARPKETYNTFIKLLETLDIVYDEIVMGLNPGPRYLINDIKPSNPFVKQALAFNLTRDDGIDKLICSESDNYKINILKIFKGNSFSITYLLKKDDNIFVRKYIKKNPKSLEHYERLKRQCEDLKRFVYYDKHLVPKILNEYDSSYDYYIDIEYLPNHKQLDEYNTEIQHRVLHTLLKRLSKNVYCFRKINNSTDFIEDFFDTKIYPKLKEFEKDCQVMNYLINGERVIINNKSYYGLRKVFELLNIHNFNTELINPIHGDLTLENILYDETIDDIKLIDMEGSRYVDSCYFDLGKIFQSIVSNYNEWNDIKVVVYDKTIDNIKCVDKYFDCVDSEYDTICNLFGKIMEVQNKSVIFKKGIFFMATYYIRFVQFRRKISEDHGIFAIIMAVVWLNKIL